MKNSVIAYKKSSVVQNNFWSSHSPTGINPVVTRSISRTAISGQSWLHRSKSGGGRVYKDEHSVRSVDTLVCLGGTTIEDNRLVPCNCITTALSSQKKQPTTNQQTNPKTLTTTLPSQGTLTATNQRPLPKTVTTAACPGGTMTENYQPTPATLVTTVACPGGTMTDNYKPTPSSPPRPGLPRSGDGYSNRLTLHSTFIFHKSTNHTTKITIINSYKKFYISNKSGYYSANVQGGN